MSNQDNDNKRPDDGQTPEDDELFGWLDDADDEFGDESDDDQMTFEWQDDDSADDERGRMEHPGASQKRIEEQMEQAEDADFGNTDELLDWMQNPEDATPDEPQFADTDDVDSNEMAWLDDVSGSADDDDTDTGFLDDLAQSDELSDTGWLDRMMQTDDLDDSDTDFLDDLAQSDELRDPDTAAPTGGTVDWDMLDTGEMAAIDEDDIAASAESDDALAAWGFDDDDTISESDTDDPAGDEDALDWDFDDEDEFDSDDAAAGEVPEWLADMEPDEPDTPDETADDLFDTIFDEDDSDTVDDSESADDFDALFADMEFDDDPGAARISDTGPAEASWLSDMDMPDPDEADTGDMSEAFAAMFGDDTGSDTDTDEDDFDWFDEERASDELDEDWLSELDEAETAETAETADSEADYTEADAVADELLAELGGADDEDLEALLAELDSDDDLTADDDDELAALLAEMEAGDSDAIAPDDTDAAASDEADFFADFEDIADTEADSTDEADFFAGLDAWDDDTADEADDEDDFFSDLDLSDMDFAADEAAPAASQEDDLDALLASFDIDEEPGTEDDEEMGLARAEDLDTIFDEMGGFDEEAPTLQEADLPGTGELEETGEIPEWLREAVASSDDTSAAALVRRRKDRSLDELDENLLRLRERGLELSGATPEDSASRERFKAVVPTIKDGLTPAQIERRQTTIAPDATFSDDQKDNAALLRSIAGSATRTQPEPQRRAFLSRLQDVPLLRWLITLFLLLAVMAPFVLNVNFGSPPPVTFEAGSLQSDAFVRVDTLIPGDTVLLAVEYGATGARELDPLTRVILEHLFVRGAQPVITSSNAVGLLRGETLAANLIGAETKAGIFMCHGICRAAILACVI